MSNEVTIVESTTGHVHQLGRVMNDEDRAEAEAAGYDPHKLVWRSYRRSLVRKTIFVDGKIAAMFGCAGVLMGIVGIPWLLTSKTAREVSPVIFHRIYRQQVREMKKIFPVLENFVDSRYSGSVKMLKISGFKIDETPRIFASGVVFYRFSA